MRSIEEFKGWDKDFGRRPGHQAYRPIEPWPNTRHPPTQQQGRPTVPRPPTPVFGTSCPLRGPSGLVRRWAYRYPEHQAKRWILLLFADRVEATGPRLRRLATYGAPVLLAGLAALGGRRRWPKKKGNFKTLGLRSPSPGKLFPMQRIH